MTAIDLSASSATYPAGRDVAGFYRDLLQRVRRAPGVTAAGAVEFLPFSGRDADTGVLFDTASIPPPDKRPRAHYRAVSDGYFEAMGIPVLAGRAFGPGDRSDRPIAVLNASAARQFFPDGRVLGRRAALDFEAMRFFPDRAPIFDLGLGLREVVGVVQDVRFSSLTDEGAPEFFVPLSQRAVRRMTLIIRSPLLATEVLAEVRAIVNGIDRDQPIAAVAALPDLIAASMARPKFHATLVTAFGVLALTLAAIGIYGVMSYLVLLRTRDIGVHVAIGATPRDVFRFVTRSMIRLAAAGLVLGLAGALLAGAGLSRLLFEVRPYDPLVLTEVAAIVLASAALATIVPALRALRIDPARALRAE